MSKEAAPYVVSWSVPINADDRSRGFTLADLQEACCRAKAPPVLTTPGSLSVVAWIQALRFGAKYRKSTEQQTEIKRWTEIDKAWRLIERRVSEMRRIYEVKKDLLSDYTATFYSDSAACLANLEHAMAQAKSRIVVNDRRRGQHGPSAVPWSIITIQIAEALRRAFAESGHDRVSSACLYRVIADVLGASPDAVRKQLAASSRGQK